MLDAYVLDSDNMQREIRASYERSLGYGIDPKQKKNPDQIFLDHQALKKQRKKDKLFYALGTAQIKELYQVFAGHGFCVVIADREGYLLDMIGDEDIVTKLKEVNCALGYRWTERDVGTAAIPLVLAKQISVQVTGHECFFARKQGYTNSAAPIFGLKDELLGVIAITGKADQVHPHTLGMVKTAAKAIENQIRMKKQSIELYVKNRYLSTILESINNVVIVVDHKGVITHINQSGKTILDWPDRVTGQKLRSLVGDQFDWHHWIESNTKIANLEVIIKKADGTPIHIMGDIDPIHGPKGLVSGGLFIFKEIRNVHKLVHHMAGTQARLSFWNILGSSRELQTTKALAKQAAMGNSTVLITGETGTGKDMFAQAIHSQSDRKDQPFVVIHCGAIPRELLESELFGYAEGSFTGARKGGRPGKLELANGGTVFLDEIGDMPSEMQVKLLRVLQSGEICRIGEHTPFEVDLRIIAATNIDLQREIERKNFRKDLFYRLNVFPISIPPLRARKEDIMLLANHFLNRNRIAFKKSSVGFSELSERLLYTYHWPGNVRELENYIERAVNLVNGPMIEPAHLGISENAPVQMEIGPDDEPLLQLAEKKIIGQVIRQTHNNIARA